MFVVNASRTTLGASVLVVRIYHSAQQWWSYANGKAAGMDVLRIPSHHPYSRNKMIIHNALTSKYWMLVFQIENALKMGQ